MKTLSRCLVFSIVFFGCLAGAEVGQAQEEAADPLEVFDQRILPIFRSSQPSSCVQCHLAGVDLKNYILPSSEKTFLSLRDQGLIDLQNPADSKILTLIRMGTKDQDEGARLIHAETRRAEEQAFAAWIEACCRDTRLRSLPPLDASDLATPEKPLKVIRHARKSRIVDSFARHVWSQRMRCFPCHTPYEIDPQNPRHRAAAKKQKEFEDLYGKDAADRLKLFQETPEATLRHLIESSKTKGQDRLPLLNLDDPTKSLLVLKPTSKLPAKMADGTFESPSSSEPVTHMGGLKMHPDDQSYKAFVAWIQDYAKIVGNEYQTIDELPQDNWYASQQVLRLRGVPSNWALATPVQLVLHRWNDKNAAWESEPAAFTQGTITPRRFVNGALFLLSQSTAKSGQPTHGPLSLKPGRYLVRVYVDDTGRLKADPALLLPAADLRAEIELEFDEWAEGFRQAKVIEGGEEEG